MSAFVAFLLISLLVVLASAKVTLQGQVSRLYYQNAQDPVLFNGVLFLAIALLLAIFFPLVAPTPTLVLAALSVSLFTFAFQTTYSSAMTAGPVSLTVLIVNFSLFIPVTVSILFYHEPVYLTQIIGTTFLILSMILNLKKEPKENAPISKKWLFLTLCAMLSTGIAIALQKGYGKSFVDLPGADTTLLCLIYLFAGAFAFLFYFLRRTVSRDKPRTSLRPDKRLILFILGIAAVLTVYQKCYMYALVTIDSATLLPMQNGLQTVLVTMIGVFFFHDKLSRRQWFGVLCGVACVVLMNLPYGPTIL